MIGDIIYTKGGTTGIAIVNNLEFDFSAWVHLAVIKMNMSCIYNRFLAIALNSTHCYEQSQKLTHNLFKTNERG